MVARWIFINDNANTLFICKKRRHTFKVVLSIYDLL